MLGLPGNTPFSVRSAWVTHFFWLTAGIPRLGGRASLAVMLSEKHPLLCWASSEDESGSSEPRRTADDEEEKVQNQKQHQDDHFSESESDSPEENDGVGKVKVHFFRQRKKGIKDPAIKTLEVSVNVRVDSITDISLEKQTFTGDLWLFLLTVEEFDPGDRREEVEEFFKEFNPKDHALHWGALQNLITAAESTDHPQPHSYKVGKKIGFAWRPWIRTINQYQLYHKGLYSYMQGHSCDFLTFLYMFHHLF